MKLQERLQDKKENGLIKEKSQPLKNSTIKISFDNKMRDLHGQWVYKDYEDSEGNMHKIRIGFQPEQCESYHKAKQHWMRTVKKEERIKKEERRKKIFSMISGWIVLIIVVAIIRWAYYLTSWVVDKDDYISRIFITLMLNGFFVITIVSLWIWGKIFKKL